MTKHNESNERIKRDYFAYLKEAQRFSEQSVDAAAMAIARFEQHNRHRDFKQFHREQAIAFKRHLVDQLNSRGTCRLSRSTVRSTLAALRKFFHWLAGRPGFRSRFDYSDADYFNPSERDSRIALAQRPRAVPTLDQILHVLSVMPGDTVVQRRDRALMAFLILTGCRDKAAVSIKLKHINLGKGFVFQDAREVETKFGKTITTYFFPVGDQPLQLVADWLAELQRDHQWGLEDPLFPATKIALGATATFQPDGIQRRHWKNADPVRRMFRSAFERAGLQYFNPHSFRHTLARLGQERCHSAEQMKAWSQNLGHEQMLTTFASYGRIEEHRQGEIIKALAKDRLGDDQLRDLFHNFVSAVRRK